MANDTYTLLNPGVGGDVLDDQAVVAPVSPINRKRGRVVLTGVDYDAIVDTLEANPSGTEISLPVRLVPDPVGQAVARFGQVSLVPALVETTVVTYLVAPGNNFRVRGFVASGDVAGKFVMYIQGSPVLTARASAAQLTVNPTFLDVDQVLSGGFSVTVKVTHRYTEGSFSFEGTIMGRLF